MKNWNINLRLLLTHYGLTDWNMQSRFQGQVDIPLNTPGCLPAEALTDRLKAYSLDVSYASDLEPTRHTASRISKYHKCSLYHTHEVRKLKLGDWEELTFPEIQKHCPSDLENWPKNQADFILPGGESLVSYQIAFVLS